MEDWFLFTLIARDGPMACVPEPVAAYRRHAGSVTASEAFRQAVPREVRRLRADIYRETSNTRAHRRVLRAAWRTHHAAKARQHARARGIGRALGHMALLSLGRPFDLSKVPVRPRDARRILRLGGSGDLRHDPLAQFAIAAPLKTGDSVKSKKTAPGADSEGRWSR